MANNKFELVYDNAISENVKGQVNIHPVSYEVDEIRVSANVYTPADYDESGEKKYPAVTVAHPNGGMKYTADSIGIVCPVFGHEMPPIVKEFIESAEFDNDYLYLILTYGNRHGGASELADEYTRSVGKQFDYINVLLMVDNFLLGFDMEQQTKLDKHIPEQLEAIRSDIAKRKHFISEVTESDREAHRGLVERNAKMPAKFHT